MLTPMDNIQANMKMNVLINFNPKITFKRNELNLLFDN